jgi:hypothetical protein
VKRKYKDRGRGAPRLSLLQRTMTSLTEPTSTTAPLNFLSRDMQERPYYRRSPKPGELATNVIIETVPTEIIDFRSVSPEARKGFTIDTSGFQVLKHVSKFDVEGFASEEKIKTEYYAEVEQ